MASAPLYPVLCYPDPPPPVVAKALDSAGYSWVAAGAAPAAERLEPGDGWAAAVVWACDDPPAAYAFCRFLKRRDPPLSPVLLLVEARQLPELDALADDFDDFALAASAGDELEARLAHLLRRTGRGKDHQVIRYGPLALNLETYQAAVGGRPLDLTFMEYELLRFLAAHPGKVFTREALLSRVWGYEYFGGARTVDVHIRRLRAKLGEEHAGLIETVRSVGYRFGRARWAP